MDTLGEAWPWCRSARSSCFVGIPALSALGRLYGWLAAQLLGSNADPVLTAQVTELQDARSRIIAAADAERRRIERDLHDGAQQRLVALALNLRMAEQRAADGDPAAAELVRQAGEEANLALKELRDLARGIHPAILTNRGLAAALEDLAARATVPVEVLASPGERLPEAVEAAAYFVVSECLANIGKHAKADLRDRVGDRADGHLDVVVADDGVGGAELGNGSGIQGLVDRVGALSGTLAVESPPGEGTRVVASIPLHGGAAEERRARGARRACCPREEAGELQAERRHHLRVRRLSTGHRRRRADRDLGADRPATCPGSSGRCWGSASSRGSTRGACCAAAAERIGPGRPTTGMPRCAAAKRRRLRHHAGATRS